MEWTASLTLKFIHEYKTRPYLWQAVHPDYKNYTLRTEGYKQIAEVFGCEVRDVKKKINSLNSSFRRERRNIVKIQDYQPTWFAYPKLKFLYEKFGKTDEGEMDEEHLDDYDGDDQTNDSISLKTPDLSTSKTNIEWTNSLTLKLIDGYGARPCLWRPKDTNFKNQYQRIEAWKQLAAMFSCEVYEVKKKISTLLTSFRRERREILNYEQQTGESYEPTWFAFNSMKFLYERYPKEENETTAEGFTEEYLLTSILNQGDSPTGEDIDLTSDIKFETDPLTAKDNLQLKRKYEISRETLNEEEVAAATLSKKPYTTNVNVQETLHDDELDDEDSNWTNVQTLKLIDAYKNRTCIWQPTDAAYRNATIKSQAWKELAKLFNCEVIDVKKKMNSLLTSFRRERREIHNYKLKTGKKLISSWFAFNSMKFLYAKFARNNAADEEQENDGRNNYQYAAKLEPQEEEFINDTSKVSMDPLAVMDEQQQQPQAEKTTTQTEDPRINEVYGLLKVAFNRTNDESATYGEHIAWKLRQYTQNVRNCVQHHINNILYDADMGKFDARGRGLANMRDDDEEEEEELENGDDNDISENESFELKRKSTTMKLRQNNKK